MNEATIWAFDLDQMASSVAHRVFPSFLTQFSAKLPIDAHYLSGPSGRAAGAARGLLPQPGSPLSSERARPRARCIPRPYLFAALVVGAMRDRLVNILITVALLTFVYGVAWFLYFLAGGLK